MMPNSNSKYGCGAQELAFAPQDAAMEPALMLFY